MRRRRMPYIKPEKRNEFEELEIIADNCETAGDLCYCFYKIICLFIKRKGLSFSTWTMCLSALESAKLEFYRKHVASYEDEKIKENGDIDL
jgi:hypothetical protein